MKKFLVLYHSETPAKEMMVQTTPEQGKAGMEAWTAWSKKNQKMIVDLGMPLGDGKKVDEGDVEDAETTVSGFSIMQGDSMDSVVAILKEHPHFKSSGERFIEVYEFLPIPGM